MTTDEVKALIVRGLPGAQVTVKDMTGTGDHFEATVVTDAFQGRSLVDMHRMVYAALGDAMKGPIHALKLDTRAA